MALEFLTNIFTGDPYKKAAEQQRAYLGGVTDKITGATGGAQTGGLAALQSGQAGALNAVQSGVNQARGDISTATPEQLTALYQGSGDAQNALIGGRDAALASLVSEVNQATAAYDPLRAAGGAYGDRATLASNMSENALGLRGPEGNAAATGAFQAGPGYKFALEQALQSATRGANVAGMAPGGNTLAALTQLGTNYGNQEFGNWQNKLMGREQLYAPLESSALSTAGQGQANAALTGGTGAANILTGTAGKLSDIFTGTAGRASDVIGGEGRSLAELASKGGLSEADIFQKTGMSSADLMARLAGTQTSGLANLAPNYANTYQTAAAGEMSGSKNLWNLIEGVAGFGAGTKAGSNLLSSFGLGKA